MIKLFRNIRKNLIAQGPPAGRAGKTTNPSSTKATAGTYLKYAIGEIFLVVIGILIALQINNWNEQRKEHSRELKMLSEIKSNLEANVINLESDIKKQILGARHIDYVIDQMDNKRAYNDSISYYMIDVDYAPDIVLISSAFENLKTSGLEIIENDSLRRQLTNLYEVEYPTLMQETKRIEDQVWPSEVHPMIQKYFRYDTVNNIIVPTAYEAWLNDQEFLNMLAFRGILRKDSTKRKRETKKETEDVLLMINNELTKRK